MADYSDDFNRGDSTDIGASWSPCVGSGLQILSNTVHTLTQPPTGTGEGAEINSTSLVDDQYVEAVLVYDASAYPSYPAVLLGTTGADSTRNGYTFSLGVRDGDWYLERTTNGSGASTIASGTTSVPASPITMRLDRSGNTLTAKLNGTTLGSGDDSTYSGGGIGLYLYWEVADSIRFDSVAFGDTSGGSVPLKKILNTYRQRRA